MCIRDSLLSLTRMSNAGHSYIGARDGFRVELKSGSTLKIPGNHRLLKMYVHRADPDGHDKHASACVVIAPGAPPNPRVVDINNFHCSHAAAFRWCRGPTVALRVGKSRVRSQMRWVISS